MDRDFHWTMPLWTSGQFKAFDASFKIPAILSDGQWYTQEKLRRFSGESIDSVIDVLHDLMTDEDMEVITNETGSSYRLSYESLAHWRHMNNIAMSAQLIPTILYPRVVAYGGRYYTEPDIFAMVPLHRFGQVRFVLNHGADISTIIDDLHYFGRFSQDETPEKWRLTCLSGDVGKELLEAYERDHGGYGTLFRDNGRPNVYNTGRQRDINKFRPQLIEPIIRFYQTFKTTSNNGESRPAILQPSAYQTLKVYADDGESGVVSQMNDWIITAIEHYDEQSGVPFAAYLGLIANNRVNDLAANAIGRTLAKFQNRKSRAIKNLRKEHQGDDMWFSMDAILGAMAQNDPEYILTPTEYAELDAQLKTWQQTKRTTELQWDESGEEKQQGEFSMRSQVSDMSHDDNNDASLSRIQRAVVHAGVITSRPEDVRLMMEMLKHSSSLGAALLSSLSTELDDNYREALADSLSSVR